MPGGCQSLRHHAADRLLAADPSILGYWYRYAHRGDHVETDTDDETIAGFQRELGALGYKFQFITLAGFHALNESMFELARGYAASGMSAYVELQQRELALEEAGYTATRHQREVGAGYFDEVAQAVSGRQSSTLALKGSTEEAQFETNGAAVDGA